MTTGDLIAAELAGAGLTYLFPYQRLVITNILEAANAASIPLAKPQKGTADQGESGEDGVIPIHVDEVPPDSVSGSDADPDTGFVPNPDIEVWSGYGRQIVILPTGAGKSLCFQLPARLMLRPTLVIFPILALMADQHRRLVEQGTRVVLLRGGQTVEERAAIAETLRKPSNTFIIANPEVLKTPRVRNMLLDAEIAHVVIDEAHCVSQWGESFRPAYLELGAFIEELKPPLITAFTATASPQVLDKIRHYIFNDGEAHLVMGNPDRPNISYRIVRTLVKEAALRKLLVTLPRPAIVFCSSRSRTEQLARSLRVALGSRDIYYYHAGLERDEKKTVEEWFFHSSTGILVATCAYGLGVDKRDIRSVIHFDCPLLVEAYLQESGRAGRDGKPATATLLWGPEDNGRTGSMAAYGKTMAQCRRQQLLDLLAGAEVPTYSEASFQGTCTGDESSCDICSGLARHRWREEEALVHLIRQNPRRFTLTEAASWLAELEQLDLSREEARRALHSLLQSGALRQSQNIPWKKALVAAK